MTYHTQAHYPIGMTLMENAKFNIFKNIYFFLKQMADFIYHHQNVHMQTNIHTMCVIL